MMSIKLGELMDQPRHVRVQALQTELAKKEEVHACHHQPATTCLASARTGCTPMSAGVNVKLPLLMEVLYEHL